MVDDVIYRVYSGVFTQMHLAKDEDNVHICSIYSKVTSSGCVNAEIYCTVINNG